MAQNTESLSSQSLIAIHQIKKGVVILKNGSLRSVLEVSGINMDLKSEDEQNIILTSWRNFLNNLNFSLEIVIVSRRVNIDKFIQFVQEKVSRESIELLKIQGEDYLNFVKNLVQENNVMRKSFYVVVPYDPILIKPTTFIDSFKTLFNMNRNAFSGINPLTNEEFNQAYQQLIIRRDMVISQLYRIGLQARPLETAELINLYSALYNSEIFEKENIKLPEEFQ
ncbi:MAG: hypothetical protein ACPLW7_03685 [Minisyncoccia bacterium]|jgi:type IV secretory pathway VirB4 component